MKLYERAHSVFLISVILVGLLGLSPAFSLLMNRVVIGSTGVILTRELYARSGSPADIQVAVDAVAAAGGGVVYIPEGNFEFNIDPNKKFLTYPTGVIIPGGVSVIGQGKDKTILRQPVDPPSSYSHMFFVDGRNGKRTRISGIKFDGYVMTTEDFYNCGIGILGATDYRVDHCSFEDFSSKAIAATNYYPPYGVNRGVVDHCDFDNPYKDNLNIPNRLWGYGIIAVGTYYNWEPNIDNLLGKYDGLSNVMYIEDCTFRRCRHCIAANGGAHYVARHNFFTEMIISWYGSYIDAHGSSGPQPAVGTRCVEIYDNIITDSPTDKRSTSNSAEWGQYEGLGVGIRGGGGVIFNNTFNHGLTGIRLYSDAVWDKCKPHDIWIWGNTFNSVTNPLVVWGDTTEGVDYFQYAKSGYTPYPYPHPLTLKATP